MTRGWIPPGQPLHFVHDPHIDAVRIELMGCQGGEHLFFDLPQGGSQAAVQRAADHVILMQEKQELPVGLRAIPDLQTDMLVEQVERHSRRDQPHLASGLKGIEKGGRQTQVRRPGSKRDNKGQHGLLLKDVEFIGQYRLPRVEPGRLASLGCGRLISRGLHQCLYKVSRLPSGRMALAPITGQEIGLNFV